MVLMALIAAQVVAAPAVSAQTPDPATNADQAAATEPPPQAAPAEPQALPEGTPRWLDAVRAQRRAQQDRRRAEHSARRRALDPLGAARQEARKQEFLRRRREVQDQMAENRRWFRNFGPWMAPLPSPPGTLQAVPGASTADTEAPPESASPSTPSTGQPPSEWNNGWYFNGW